MAFLFTVENSTALPNTETLLISPFKDIWERNKNKETAIKEFTFIELMTSKKKTNPYAGYSDTEREIKLKALLFDKNWKPDNLILEGIAKVIEFQKEASPTYSYYTSVLEATEKMKDFFKTFDINETNEKGVRTFKPNEIVMAIANTDKVLQNLNSMKEKVEQELFEQTKTKSNKQINPFEM